jgi:hypothetical protein
MLEAALKKKNNVLLNHCDFSLPPEYFTFLPEC